MSIATVSATSPLTVQANQAPRIKPFQRDRDGDYDNNKAETTRSEAAETRTAGTLLNLKA